ncbi:hypothetical protein F2Q68_00003663 [Brassica cretica]|uniref:Homeobox domain-containing protein n=1 Tax=Brassica cretica TaxID=69181 RepID=A0A8S9JMN8_BRACR|nr:hypothetical protein F2Q68_00003663 [Brassica cretica]
MFETFTDGLQTALLTSVENALTTALQNLRNRLAVQSQQAIFMEINSKDDLCGEYREIIGDPIFDIYDDDNHIQDLSNELNVQDQEAEYLKFSSEKRVQIFNKINSKDVYGHEKQNMNGVSWKEDCLGFLSYQDMAAQELLDEAVNVKKALKQFQPEGDKTEEDKEKNLQESITNPDLPQAERQELQNKLSKLLSILDEVDRRYKQYYHQMQIVVSSFDVIAGCGAAKPYTALALQTISRHFRCLRDAISGQILVIRRSLGGEHDGLDGRGVGISRLRNVDQKVRQQRALQRLGVMQPHAWRPQRGLPDSSVLILRAWLFEHFLHPYPKDSDKIMLARQTGLSRGQVSNWFINARVRLWKPMVEEMYKEEFTDALEENVTNLSSGNNRPETTESQEQQLVSSSNNGGASTSAVARGGEDQLMMVTEMTRNGSGGMSLTLGIPDNYENSFQYLNSGNGQHRLGSSQLLQDFVA